MLLGHEVRPSSIDNGGAMQCSAACATILVQNATPNLFVLVVTDLAEVGTSCHTPICIHNRAVLYDSVLNNLT